MMIHEQFSGLPGEVSQEIMSASRVLLTSVCKPIGPSVGDAESVGYELLHGQVTRAQHIYSPRVVHVQYEGDVVRHKDKLRCTRRRQ